MIRPETLWWGLVLLGIVFFLSIQVVKIVWLSNFIGISLMFGAILWSAYAFVLYPHIRYERLQELKKEIIAVSSVVVQFFGDSNKKKVKMEKETKQLKDFWWFGFLYFLLGVIIGAILQSIYW